MVHGQSSRYRNTSQDARDRPSARPQRNHSPSMGQGNYRRSPRRQVSPVRSLMDGKGDNRGEYRRGEGRGNVGSISNREFSGGTSSRKGKKPRKGRRNRKSRGNKSRPFLSGGNSFPVNNRQLVATMRMRMDDYANRPRLGRMLPMGKSSDIDRAVARARREASTRTKDTFWTKKLLDAESSHPNRWAHSGFKELYREELGYSELDYKEKDKRTTLSPLRGSKDEPKRSRSSPSNKQRSSRERLTSSHKVTNFGKNNSRKMTTKRSHSRSRSVSKSRSRSRSLSRSPRGRRRRRRRLSHPPKSGVIEGSRKIPRPMAPKRPYSHSLSRSPTSTSSSSTSSSRSCSRSYSSYSRSSSSSRTSSSTSSSFSTSSIESLRNRGRRRGGRTYRKRTPPPLRTKSWSRSPPTRSPLPNSKIKAVSLSKVILQSVHSIPEKKKIAKPAPSNSGTLPPDRTVANSGSGVKVKAKGKLKVPPRTTGGIINEPSLIHSTLHGSPLVSPGSPNGPLPLPPSNTGGEYYDKDGGPNKASAPSSALTAATPFVEAVDKASFKKMDVRRGPDTQYYKGATQLSREVNTSHRAATPNSDGGQQQQQSNSDSSTDDEDGPMKMTLSERFGKLAQLSSQRQEYDGVRMKIVREGGQDKKVYLERDSRSTTPRGRRSTRAHERWLREHKEEYDEYEERYGEFRHWDPHRDLPRELPPNWDDVNVRYRYYKESGYFGERSITMEDYLKWEEWWYRYRDWLEKYGGVQEESRKYRGPYSYEVPSRAPPVRDRWVRREKDDRKRHRY